MKRSDVVATVIEILTSIEAAIGATPPAIITEGTTPIGDLPMFDSILAEDTTVEIFRRFGLQADVDENPFIVNRKACTVGQVVDRVCSLLEAA